MKVCTSKGRADEVPIVQYRNVLRPSAGSSRGKPDADQEARRHVEAEKREPREAEKPEPTQGHAEVTRNLRGSIFLCENLRTSMFIILISMVLLSFSSFSPGAEGGSAVDPYGSL